MRNISLAKFLGIDVEKMKERQKYNSFLEKNGIMLNICTARDKQFLKTAYKYYQNGWSLSERQEKWLNDIKARSLLRRRFIN